MRPWQDNISPNNARWLQGLSQGKIFDDDPVVLVHGSLVERDAYILNGAEIKRNLEGNICRCTGYSKVIDAVADVAGNLKNVSTL